VASGASQRGAAQERDALPVDFDRGLRLHVFDATGCRGQACPRLGRWSLRGDHPIYVEEYVAHGGWRAACTPTTWPWTTANRKASRQQRVISEIRTLTRAARRFGVPSLCPPCRRHRAQGIGWHIRRAQDITERKRAEAILEASERRLSLIFDYSWRRYLSLVRRTGDCFRFASVIPLSCRDWLEA